MNTDPIIAEVRRARDVLAAKFNYDVAAMVRDATIYGATSLLAVCAHLTGVTPLEPFASAVPAPAVAGADLVDVCGQAQAKRVLEIAAAGAHSLLLIGPPGTGKSKSTTKGRRKAAAPSHDALDAIIERLSRASTRDDA